jgi:hypothetical protein
MTDLDSFSLQIKGEGIIKKELKDEILTRESTAQDDTSL